MVLFRTYKLSVSYSVCADACYYALARFEAASGRYRFRKVPTLNIKDYLKITEAATFLGVSTNTLCNWERSGKRITDRHSVNQCCLLEG